MVENDLGKGAEKKPNKKSINDGFMHECVAEKCEIMDSFHFFTVAFVDNFLPSLGKKNETSWIFLYVCMCKAKSMIDGFLLVFLCTFPLKFLTKNLLKIPLL